MGTLAGAVLCGGSSRRMGTDKALIEIDGIAMAERVARVLEAAGCAPVVFVGGDPTLAAIGRRIVADRYPGEGPVGGVITALDALRDCRAVVVAACDLPDLSVEVVKSVIGVDVDETDIRVADSGRIEPALGCWPTSRREQIERSFEQGTRALHEVITESEGIRVAVPITALRNVNRPDDL